MYQIDSSTIKIRIFSFDHCGVVFNTLSLFIWGGGGVPLISSSRYDTMIYSYKIAKVAMFFCFFLIVSSVAILLDFIQTVWIFYP